MIRDSFEVSIDPPNARKHFREILLSVFQMSNHTGKKLPWAAVGLPTEAAVGCFGLLWAVVGCC